MSPSAPFLPPRIELLRRAVGLGLRHAGTHTAAMLSCLKEGGAFVRQWAGHPRATGAIAPSGPVLAARMASLVPPGPGLVIELGPGTGSVTRALLHSGVDPRDLILVEYAPDFCRALRRRFPRLTVLEGDAARLDELLAPRLAHVPVKAVVSSLPLVSLPDDTRTAVIRQMRAVAQHGVIIQFTYALWGPSILQKTGCARDDCRFALCNLPPARVERFRN